MWDNLDKCSSLLQIINFLLLLEDNSNNDIMEELQKQNKLYLEEINRKLDILIERK